MAQSFNLVSFSYKRRSSLAFFDHDKGERPFSPSSQGDSQSSHAGQNHHHHHQQQQHHRQQHQHQQQRYRDNSRVIDEVDQSPITRRAKRRLKAICSIDEEEEHKETEKVSALHNNPIDSAAKASGAGNILVTLFDSASKDISAGGKLPCATNISINLATRDSDHPHSNFHTISAEPEPKKKAIPKEDAQAPASSAYWTVYNTQRRRSPALGSSFSPETHQFSSPSTSGRRASRTLSDISASADQCDALGRESTPTAHTFSESDKVVLLKEMFPSFDAEVVEVVLAAEGNLNNAVTALFDMASATPKKDLHVESTEARERIHLQSNSDHAKNLFVNAGHAHQDHGEEGGVKTMQAGMDRSPKSRAVHNTTNQIQGDAGVNRDIRTQAEAPAMITKSGREASNQAVNQNAVYNIEDEEEAENADMELEGTTDEEGGSETERSSEFLQRLVDFYNTASREVTMREMCILRKIFYIHFNIIYIYIYYVSIACIYCIHSYMHKFSIFT